jgi:RNA polymerase sigma factor (sigma-70 family)
MEPGLVRRSEGHESMSLDFEALVGPYVEEMYRLAAAIVGTDDARDVTQDALVAAWRGFARLRDRASVRAWLHAILVNHSRNALRTRSRRPRVIRIDDSRDVDRLGSVGDSSATGAEHDRLDRAFETLTPDQRTVLALRYTLDLSIPQVAATLGIPLGTAKSRVHGAVERLRAALGEKPDA